MSRPTPFVLAQMLLEIWRVAPRDVDGDQPGFQAPLTVADLARIQNYRWNWHKIQHAV